MLWKAPSHRLVLLYRVPPSFTHVTAKKLTRGEKVTYHLLTSERETRASYLHCATISNAPEESHKNTFIMCHVCIFMCTQYCGLNLSICIYVSSMFCINCVCVCMCIYACVCMCVWWLISSGQRITGKSHLLLPLLALDMKPTWSGRLTGPRFTLS